MDEQIVATFCLCDDYLKSIRHQEDAQRKMTDAEVMTTALVAACFFGGNVERSRGMLATPFYIPHMLSKSRLNRRIHALEPHFLTLLDRLAETWKQDAEGFVIDTYPILVCDNIRFPDAVCIQTPSGIAATPPARSATSMDSRFM